MNVIGVLVHAMPESVEQVEAALAAMPGVDVHSATADGRLVVTATDAGAHLASESLMSMSLVNGVIGASLVYHACESDEEAAVAA
ncbi:MAG: chaperone NapD [Hyphomicrobiales bacterium]|nr:chaperone NapD [Hyphomicrobiales bacterium]